MGKIEFKELRSSREFEELCADLLSAEGCTNVRGLGVGSDQGRDILIDVPVTTPLRLEVITFLVQCKWYSASQNMNVGKITETFSSLAQHRVQGALIITSSSFSGSAVSKAESLDQDSGLHYRMVLWDGAELERRLRKYPMLIAKYFYESGSGSLENEEGTAHITDEGADLRFAPPRRFVDVTIHSFPRTPHNAEDVAILETYAAEFADNPPVVTLVAGSIGSGKTGFGYALLNGRRRAGAAIAGVHSYDYRDIFYSYSLRGDTRLPSVLAYIVNVDFLLVDDFGSGLEDKSETQIAAARTLIDVVKRRIHANRPTVIVMTTKGKPGNVIRDYTEYLKRRHPTVNCGNVDLRRLHGSSKSEPVVDVPIWLGKAWLHEKFSLYGALADEAREIVLTPEEELHAKRHYIKEAYGEEFSREQAIIDVLNYLNNQVKEHVCFIESLPFHAIRFDDDGAHLLT